MKVASWRIFDNRVAGRDTVYFLGVDPAAAELLLGNLKDFEVDLPRGVEVTYYPEQPE